MVLLKFLYDQRLLGMKTSNAKCNVCKNKAVIFYKGKWWCGRVSGFGEFNIKGECSETSNARRRDNDSEQG